MTETHIKQSLGGHLSQIKLNIVQSLNQKFYNISHFLSVLLSMLINSREKAMLFEAR